MHKTTRLFWNFRIMYNSLIQRQNKAVWPAFRTVNHFSVLSYSSALKQCHYGGNAIASTFQHIKRNTSHNENSDTSDCWYCEAQTTKWKHMVCYDCGHLRDVVNDINYFDLLNVPQTFGLDAKTLTKNFRYLQTVVHPDMFTSKAFREQVNSQDWSSLINSAYKTLYAPIERGQYLLKLEGVEMPQDNSALDKVFLMDMMERNEEVEAANTKKTLFEINQRLSIEVEQKMDKLTHLFNDKDYKMATSILVELKYLSSIQNAIKEKQQKKIS